MDEHTEQCKTCKFSELRKCMYHGYSKDTIPPSCHYKIGVSAEEAQCNICTKKRKSIASFAGVSPSKREFEIRAAVLDEQEPSYEDLVDFARWTQTLWKNGIDIMRRNHLVIKSDAPMEKLAFTFYSDLCEIDAKVRHLFEEEYGDKNYKDEEIIPIDLLKYPTEQDIRRDERDKVLDEYANWMKKHHYPTTGGHRIIGYEKLKEGLQSLRTKPSGVK